MTPPAAAAAHSSAPTLPGRRRVAVRHPRRVSGPVRAPTRGGGVTAGAVALPGAPARRSRAQQTPGIALRVVGTLNGASQSALLDRLIRSRVWIGLIAFSLIGLVAIQVLSLHLNTQVGRLLAREATLARQDAQLSISASQDSSGGLVEPAAAAAGMSVVPAGSLHFLAASSSSIGGAVATLRAPLQPQMTSSEPTTAATAGEAAPASEPSTSSTGAPTGEASAGEASSTASGEASTHATAGTGQGSPAAAASAPATNAETGGSPGQAAGG